MIALRITRRRVACAALGLAPLGATYLAWLVYFLAWGSHRPWEWSLKLAGLTVCGPLSYLSPGWSVVAVAAPALWIVYFAATATTRVGDLRPLIHVLANALWCSFVPLMMFWSPFDRDEGLACQMNLQEIYKYLITYKTRYGELPEGSGVSFFAAPIARGNVENIKANAERLTCPAILESSLAIGDLPWEEWWIGSVHGDYSAYAGRDQVNFPLSRLSADEPLVACDNNPSMNHADLTYVLYGDGSIRSYSLKELKAQGIVDQEVDILIVGPGSPIPDLRKLSLD